MIKTTKRSLLVSVATMAMLLSLAAAPALAITNGTPDGDGHPHVGIMVAQTADGVPLWRCSGTLVDERVFVTAGHCTESPAAHVEIWFDSGYPTPIPLGAGYPSSNPDNPCDGITGYPCTGDVSGTPYTHPDYDPDNFVVRDLGLVILDTAVTGVPYATLPALNSLDSLKPSSKTTFTAVGYGLQDSYPDAAAWKNEGLRTRMVAHPQLKQINKPNTGDFAMLLVANASDGGTCFGDSGGPNFLGDSNVLAAVTSFGWNRTCAGTSGVFRLDRSWSLAFINDALNDYVMGNDYDGGNS